MNSIRIVDKSRKSNGRGPVVAVAPVHGPAENPVDRPRRFDHEGRERFDWRPTLLLAALILVGLFIAASL